MMRRCRTCCLPDSKPDIYFDASGQCSACISFAKRPTIDWEARGKELVQLLDRFDGRVIVPSSGGKDSSYIALRMKEMGADVTAVTATTCHLTPIGRANLDNLARHVRTIEITPNMTVRAKLNRLALRLVGDVSWPEHASIFSVPFRVAVERYYYQRDPQLLMFGENSQAEYGGPLGSDESKEMTRRWVTEFGGFNGLRPNDFVDMEAITSRDMMDYMWAPGWSDAKFEAHFLGAYESWDSHRNASKAEANGFRFSLPATANWWLHENQDNAQTGLHDHLMFKKYGYGRGCAQISVDVRSGVIEREDAMRWVEGLDGSFPHVYAGVSIEAVLDRIGMTRAELDEIILRFTNKELFSCSQAA